MHRLSHVVAITQYGRTARTAISEELRKYIRKRATLQGQWTRVTKIAQGQIW